MRLNATAVTVLIILLALIYLGLLERVLERMRLNTKQALVLLLLILLGGSLPAIPLFKGLSLNPGGMLIPLAVAVYLMATAEEKVEKRRSFLAITVTAVAVWIVDRLLPLEPGLFPLDIDPLYLPALVAAAVGYATGRSRRASFIGAVTGVLLVDLIAWGENMVRGFTNAEVILGGGGAFGAAVLSGVLAVLLAEGVGEIRERLQRIS